MNEVNNIVCGQHGWQINKNKKEVIKASLRGLKLRQNERISNPEFDVETWDFKEGRVHLYYKSKGWEMQDTLTVVGEGFYQIERRVKNKGDVIKTLSPFLDVETCFKPTFYMIPCVNYNGNQWGNGNEPKGLTRDGQPWVFAYNRSSLPSASFSEDKEFAVGLFADINGVVESSCSLIQGDEGLIHRIMWPDSEGPYTYSNRDTYEKSVEKWIELEPEGVFSAKVYLTVNEVGDECYGWTQAYDKSWELIHHKEPLIYTPDQVFNLGIDYAKQLLDSEEEYNLPNIGFYETDDGWKLRESNKYEIGWCGQHASLATAFIKSYLINGDKQSLEHGERILDTWINHAPTDTGLFHVIYNTSIDEAEKSHKADTCNLGWGAWYMLEAYQLAKEAGLNKERWLETSLKMCDFFVAHYDESFYFGKEWDVVTGECTASNGTIGGFIIIPLLKGYEMTKNKKYLGTAIKAFKGYVERDLNKMECTAGALDTTCVDKETCWPLLKCGLDLFELTGEAYYLESAKKAGYYLLSWMMHFETTDQEDNGFSRYGYKSFGGTAVSAQHHHLDPWGALIALDWMRLGQILGDVKWEQRARATWQNSLYCISDGTLEINGRIRPRGSQNEAYFHCNWSFNKTGTSGSRLNDWLVAWPTAFRLVTLMRLQDWDKLR